MQSLFGDSKPGTRQSRTSKSASAYRTISEVADELDLATHVLRFWESKFTQITPLKRAGGRRFYRPEDIAMLRQIKTLLHDDGYTIKGVQSYFKNNKAEAKPKVDDVLMERELVSELREIRKLLG